jgi:hypothetical protein|tara:strand:- start:1114 stop:1332 length:219 start_codon:yes stop_codon:yes gene_type:complete
VRYEKEGNILSFKILINKQGKLITELSGLPEEEINNVFKDIETRAYIRTLIREGRSKLTGLHEYLEKQIASL